jgi:hypothetical protein
MLPRRPITAHHPGFPTRADLLAGFGAGLLAIAGCGDGGTTQHRSPASDSPAPQPVSAPDAPPTTGNRQPAATPTVPPPGIPPPVQPPVPAPGTIPLSSPTDPVQPETPIKGAVRPVTPSPAGGIRAPEPVRPEVQTRGEPVAVSPPTEVPGPVPTPVPAPPATAPAER